MQTLYISFKKIRRRNFKYIFICLTAGDVQSNQAICIEVPKYVSVLVCVIHQLS
jgi:hypothetical protein